MCVLSAPLGHINVHVRAGTILLLYDNPKDTLAATKAECSYRILAFLDEKGCAAGSVTLDDGSTVDGELTPPLNENETVANVVYGQARPSACASLCAMVSSA